MKTFIRYLNESISYTYTIPKDTKSLFFDFYAWQFIYSRIKNMNSSELIDEDTFVDLKDIANHAFHDLVDYLYDEVKFASLYGIVSEIQYSKYKESKHTVKISKIIDYYQSIQSFNAKQEYQKLEKIINDNGISVLSFVEICSELFGKMTGNNTYGGPAWKRICDGFINFLTINKNFEDRYIMIDHMLSLQHNTGAALNKVPRFQSLDKSWQDLKSSSHNTSKLMSNSSIPQYLLGYYNRILGLKEDPIIWNIEKLKNELTQALKLPKEEFIKTVQRLKKHNQEMYERFKKDNPDIVEKMVKKIL